MNSSLAFFSNKEFPHMLELKLLHHPKAVCFLENKLQFLEQPINGVWHNWTFYDFGQEVRKMAAYIKSLKLKKNSKIGILSKNCAHWIMSDLAIMLSGHISVPLYPNLNSESLNKILSHSETQLLFVGKLDNFDLMKDGIPSNINCITFPFYSQDYPIWDDLISGIQPIKDNIEIDANELASIMYTSGTTSNPKGCPLG